MASLAQSKTCLRHTHARRTPFQPSTRSCRGRVIRAASKADRDAEHPAVSPLLAMAGAAIIGLSAVQPTYAMAQKVGEFQASGFLFKDSVELTAIDDPEIQGVTVYVSDFKRSLVDKLAKDFFSEPSQASISCAVTGPVSFRQGSPDKLGGSEGSELFSESKGLNLFKNKTLRIRRTYDAARNTVVYTAYSTRLSTASDDGSVSSGRYRTSLCALKLPDPVAAPELGTPEAN